MMGRQTGGRSSVGGQGGVVRRLLSGGTLLVGLVAVAGLACAQEHHPAPIERRPPAAQNNRARQSDRSKQESAGQRHLGEWLEQHRNLSFTQQQQALDREPGFGKLNPQVQQRMNQRLQQLNSMSPERRDRAIERIEAMERLAPAQRQELRGAMRQLGSLPPDQRRAVARSFHSLQQMPPMQRQQYLNSPQLRGQFNAQEWSALDRLVRVAPLLPAETDRPR